MRCKMVSIVSLSMNWSSSLYDPSYDLVVLVISPTNSPKFNRSAARGGVGGGSPRAAAIT